MVKCAVKGCEREAFVAYGNNWICGMCMVKLMERERQEKDRRLKELET